MEWVIYFGLASMCYTIHKLLVSYINHNREEDLKKGWRVLLAWIVAISIFGAYSLYQEKTYIKDDELYYVNLFETIDSQKNYRVPGLIYVEDDGYELIKVYWNGGGELSFDSGSNYLKEGEKVIMDDEEGKGWYVELTNVRAELP